MSLLSSGRLGRRTHGTTGRSALPGSLGGWRCAAIQMDNRLKKWADGNLVKFNKRKCEVLHLGRNNSMHQNMLGAAWLKNSFAERVLEVLVDNNLTMS